MAAYARDGNGIELQVPKTTNYPVRCFARAQSMPLCAGRHVSRAWIHQSRLGQRQPSCRFYADRFHTECGFLHSAVRHAACQAANPVGHSGSHTTRLPAPDWDRCWRAPGPCNYFRSWIDEAYFKNVFQPGVERLAPFWKALKVNAGCRSFGRSLEHVRLS